MSKLPLNIADEHLKASTMFAKKSKQGVDSTRMDSLIGENIRLVGDVHFANGLRVDGHIEGNVTGATPEKNLIVLSPKGSITGCVQVHDAIVNGKVIGDLVVGHFLELQANACVTGNIRYRQLQMACGAVVQGRLMQQTDEAGSEPAGTRPDLATLESNPVT